MVFWIVSVFSAVSLWRKFLRKSEGEIYEMKLKTVLKRNLSPSFSILSITDVCTMA
jgi:hypothetical protein